MMLLQDCKLITVGRNVSAGLDQQHTVAPCCRNAVRKHRSGRTATNDDIIIGVGARDHRSHCRSAGRLAAKSKPASSESSSSLAASMNANSGLLLLTRRGLS